MLQAQQIFQRARGIGISTACLAEISGISRARLEKISVGQLDLGVDETKHVWNVLANVEQMLQAFEPFVLDLKNPKFLKNMLVAFNSGRRLNEIEKEE